MFRKHQLMARTKGASQPARQGCPWPGQDSLCAAGGTSVERLNILFSQLHFSPETPGFGSTALGHLGAATQQVSRVSLSEQETLSFYRMQFHQAQK